MDPLKGAVNNFGDSITCGAYVPTSAAYTTLLDANFAGAARVYCQGGEQAADLARVYVYPNTPPSTQPPPLSTIMVGTNDVVHCASAPGCLANYKEALYASVAWLAIPATDKLLAQTIPSRTGAWTNDDSILPGLGLRSTTNGSTLTLPVQQVLAGRRLYIAWHAADGTAGTANLLIDGVLVDTLSSSGNSGQPIYTLNQVSDTIFLRSYPLGGLGTHTAHLTITSPTTDANTFSLLWAGVPSANYQIAGTPRVLAGGVLRFIRGDQDADTGNFDAIVQSMVADLSADGLYVQYVPTRAAVDPFSDMYNGLHPNESGQLKISQAFLAALH